MKSCKKSWHLFLFFFCALLLISCGSKETKKDNVKADTDKASSQDNENVLEKIGAALDLGDVFGGDTPVTIRYHTGFDAEKYNALEHWLIYYFEDGHVSDESHYYVFPSVDLANAFLERNGGADSSRIIEKSVVAFLNGGTFSSELTREKLLESCAELGTDYQEGVFTPIEDCEEIVASHLEPLTFHEIRGINEKKDNYIECYTIFYFDSSNGEVNREDEYMVYNSEADAIAAFDRWYAKTPKNTRNGVVIYEPYSDAAVPLKLREQIINNRNLVFLGYEYEFLDGVVTPLMDEKMASADDARMQEAEKSANVNDVEIQDIEESGISDSSARMQDAKESDEAIVLTDEQKWFFRDQLYSIAYERTSLHGCDRAYDATPFGNPGMVVSGLSAIDRARFFDLAYNLLSYNDPRYEVMGGDGVFEVNVLIRDENLDSMLLDYFGDTDRAALDYLVANSSGDFSVFKWVSDGYLLENTDVEEAELDADVQFNSRMENGQLVLYGSIREWMGSGKSIGFSAYYNVNARSKYGYSFDRLVMEV